jgi:Mn2+/Fe2+ NRAMP family transporter
MKNMSSRDRRIILFSALFVVFAVQAFAFTTTAGTTGATGAEFFDAAKGLAEGYVGKTVALGGLAAGLFLLFKGAILPACGCAVAGVGFAKLGAITDSMGYIA